MTRLARAGSSFPIATILPLETATSAANHGAPVPSTTRPLRRSRSSREEAGVGAAADAPTQKATRTARKTSRFMRPVYDRFVSVRDRGGRAVDLLEQLVAIPSVTGCEESIGDFLEERFRTAGWTVEPVVVSPGRRNLWIHRGYARLAFSTHCDTVPDHFGPRREGRVLFGRGACDAKASLAAMAVAMEDLGRDTEEIGLLVLVGEEKGSDGAIAANRAAAPGIEFLIGGEPTGNRYVAGSKGCLRICAQTHGVAGHSSIARPDRSAIDRMLDFLGALRAGEFPTHSVLERRRSTSACFPAERRPT